MVKNIDWALVKTDYMTENLMADKDQPFTLKELSVRWKIAYKTIRNKASAEGWNDELRERIADQQMEILQRVKGVMVETEVEIRQRQAQVARYLSDKALRRLISIPMEELTNREAIDLMKFSLGEERKALGLADRYEVSHSVEIDDSPTVADQIARHKLGGALVGKLLTYLEQTDSIQGNCN